MVSLTLVISNCYKNLFFWLPPCIFCRPVYFSHSRFVNHSLQGTILRSIREVIAHNLIVRIRRAFYCTILGEFAVSTESFLPKGLNDVFFTGGSLYIFIYKVYLAIVRWVFRGGGGERISTTFLVL
jgi:hypothetical protein